jgi:riboflavin synthase
VNVERALKLSSRLGGHFVSGHIDAKAEVKSIQKNGDFLKLTFSLPVVIKPYIVDKGSIAINGISLTVAQVEAQSFSVFVIPQTIRNTTLFEVKTGALVNIEADILAKYTERLLNNSGEVSSKKQDDSLNEKFLKENGFF